MHRLIDATTHVDYAASMREYSRCSFIIMPLISHHSIKWPYRDWLSGMPEIISHFMLRRLYAYLSDAGSRYYRLIWRALISRTRFTYNTARDNVNDDAFVGNPRIPNNLSFVGEDIEALPPMPIKLLQVARPSPKRALTVADQRTVISQGAPSVSLLASSRAGRREIIRHQLLPMPAAFRSRRWI